MTESDPIKAAEEVMEGFMSAFNAEDAEALRNRWFHFPHVRFHSGQVSVMQRPEDFYMYVWSREGQAQDWHHTAWELLRGG